MGFFDESCISDRWINLICSVMFLWLVAALVWVSFALLRLTENPTPMTRQEVIAAAKECFDAGMSAGIITDSETKKTVNVICKAPDCLEHQSLFRFRRVS